VREIPLTPMGVLDPGSAHARPSTRPPIDMSEDFPVHMSAQSPSNIYPNPSKVISNNFLLKIPTFSAHSAAGRGSPNFCWRRGRGCENIILISYMFLFFLMYISPTPMTPELSGSFFTHINCVIYQDLPCKSNCL
jgi:hypothetical protein